MLIEERLEFQGDPEDVWRRMSDVEKIPEYWHGTRSLEVVAREKDGNGMERVRVRTRFAFGGSGEATITVDPLSRTVTWVYNSGPFKGVQTARVVGKTAQANWDVKFTGLFKITASWTAGHFRSGTVHALERLCGKAPEKTVPQA
ncbi:MAG TPA: SRPBCC family protein [Nitrososphaerales archaeon]|nr:SRPBCC family protein [Nitrososphaerales archaeon]